MGNPAQRGKRGPAANLNQNPIFEMASNSDTLPLEAVYE
jgi:hypothetical protein